MSSGPSASSQSSSLKTKLKKWEHQFKATEGRLPTKADIKANPEIAQMYQTYNSSRKGPKTLGDAHHLPPSSNIDNPVYSTPSRSNQTQRSTKPPKSIPQDASKSYSNLKAGINSPRKLKKLVQEHSSPRKVISTKSQKQSVQLKQTPSRLISQSPFDFDSGGGKGSPNLFADLLLESKKETPRTKARKFLSGVGSPLKVSKVSTSENLSNPDDQGDIRGLSSFLKKTAKTPEKQSVEEKIFDPQSGDNDDEILGPSPFKPISNTIFQPLFEDPANDKSDHHTLFNSPTKSINSKWKKISSATPFIPHSQNSLPKLDQTLEKEPAPGQVESKKNLGLGIKRKRMGLGSGMEENARFYEDLPDPSKAQTSSISSLNKKKRFEKSSKKASSNKRSDSNPTNTSFNKRVKPVQLAPHVLSEDDSENEEGGEELLSTIPDLPYGNPSQSAVYTELETFKFTRPTDDIDKDEEQEESGTTKAEKGKGKVKSKVDAPTTKPTKLGTQKILVRAYRPIESSQLKPIDPGPSFLGVDDFDQLSGRNDEIDIQDYDEEEAEGVGEEDDSEKLESDPPSDPGEDVEAQADLQISEELMNTLNIDNNLTIEGEDRSHLLRELKRNQQVREILEGRRLTVFEKTFTTRPPSNQSFMDSKQMPAKGRKPSKLSTKQSKSTPNPIPSSSSLQTTSKNLPGYPSDRQLVDHGHRESDDNSLQFELGLDELRTQEQFEVEINGDDDDWEDEPLGWKKSENFNDFGIDGDDDD